MTTFNPHYNLMAWEFYYPHFTDTKIHAYRNCNLPHPDTRVSHPDRVPVLGRGAPIIAGFENQWGFWPSRWDEACWKPRYPLKGPTHRPDSLVHLNCPSAPAEGQCPGRHQRETECSFRGKGWEDSHHHPSVEPYSHMAKSESAFTCWSPLAPPSWLPETPPHPIWGPPDAVLAAGSQPWPEPQSFFENSQRSAGPGRWRLASACPVLLLDGPWLSTGTKSESALTWWTPLAPPWGFPDTLPNPTSKQPNHLSAAETYSSQQVGVDLWAGVYSLCLWLSCPRPSTGGSWPQFAVWPLSRASRPSTGGYQLQMAL